MNPAKMREYLDGSRLDEDDFVINDIPLKIPPTSIKIDKESFNFSFNTLRTKSDAIIKSGRSFVRISIDVIFQGEDDINSNLVPIVAGLRATPFCAVINKYIENQIQTIEEETDDFSKLPMTKDEEEGIKSYYHLKPVVLALTNMTFSTMGHENMTDCIAANFEFIWFNHLPYTPIWAYKVGPLFAQPGPPWESEAWKAFYQPFLSEGYYSISESMSTNDYPTIFRFKELKLFHDTNKNVAQASVDLVNVFSNKRTQAVELFRKFLVEDRTYNKNNLYDKFYQSLLKAGVITSTLSDDVNNNFNGEITSYTRNLLDDSIKNLIKSDFDLTDKDVSHKESIKYLTKAEGASVWNTIASILPWNWFDEEEENLQANKQKAIANREKSKSEFLTGINNAARELKDRLNKIDKIDQDFKAINSGEFNKEWTYADYDIKYQSSHQPQQFPSTVLKLFGRNRKLTLSTDTDAIVTRISVSFRNNFSIIPMAGYRYPTCQYVGSPSPVVEFEINASNEATAKINQVYDRLDFTSLKFKQVPQGFINLTIENNFLKLFKLEEFQTESISANTIPSQPNRSAILLQLADATVVKNSSLQDSEQLTQEFVVSDDATRQEIFKVLKNYLAKENTSKNLVNQPVAFKWFARIEGIVPNDGRTKALFSLIERARNHYNNLIKTTGIAITSGDSPQMVGVAEVKNLDHRKYGYIPNLEEYQKFVDEFSKHWVDSGVGGPEAPQPIGEMSVNDRLKQLRIESDEEYNRIIGRRNLINEFDPKQKTIDPKTGMPKTQPLFQGKTPEEIKDMKKLGLQKIGLFQYMQSMRILLDEILEKYLYLDDFQAARALKFKKGLGKGNPAYPDFYNQIKSVAALDKTKQKETIIKDPKVSVKELETSSILQYDPDTYLWYPIFDGSVSATNLIDPKVISDAKVLSKKSNENAQKTVNDFFANKYVPILKNEVTNEPEHKEYTPYRILEKSFHSNPFDRGNKPDRIELQPPLYEDKSYTNSSTSSKMDEEGSDGIGIKHQIVPDPSKGFPNWYPQHGQKIQADQVIEHTTNFGKLWGDNGGVIFGKQNGPIGQPIGQVIDTSKATKAPPTSKKKNIELARQFTKKAAEKYRVDEALILATIEHESGFNPNCDSPNYVYMTDQVTGKKVKTNTIKSRDKGFMQINDVAYKNAISKMEKGIFDPETNIMFGTQLIAQRLQYWQKRLGKDKGFYAAIASYNVGDGGVEKLLNQGTDLSQGPYVKKTVARIAYWQSVVGKTSLQRREPTTTAVQKINEQRVVTPDKDVLGTHAAPIMESIKEFEISAMKGEVQSLLRAYPTFKLYFIEDDSGERKRLAFDDFFSYSAVKSIRVVKDKDIAADLLVLELTNISGVLSNRKFRQSPRSDKPRDAKGNIVKETMDPMKANTRDENPMTSLLLQEGTHIHLKLGFSNDPDLLDPVFTGKISEIEFSEGDNLITIVAQSYATELVMDRKGIENPIEKETKWWSFWGIADYATTGKILEEMISQPEVVHFGRWEPSRGTNDIEGDPGTPNRDLLTDKWQFKSNPADDNIFAPHPDHEIDSFGSGLFFPDIQFTIANTTIWDIFQEMTLRHPNYIASPALYKDYNGERMTMFFGLPNQLYFARHPSMEEEMIQNKLKALAEEIQDKTREKVRASSSRTISRTGHAQIVAMSEQSSEFDITQLENFGILNEIKQKRFEEAKKSGYIKPFRSYHIATSRHHIVANNIEANSQGVATNVCIQYPIIKEAKVGVEKELLGLTYTGTEKMEIKDMKEFMMKLDAALPANYTNTQYAEFPNVKNIDLAKRYGVAMLKRNIQNIYKGDITLIGNPRLKPYDVLYLFDEASDMVGPVEIKRVIHYFSQENGFVTEVVPQMLVSAAEWTLLNTTESIGMIAENLFRTLTNSESQSMSPLAWCIGGGVSLFGGSTAWKIINYASTTQPIVMSPLAHHGRIFAGGIPTSKLPVSIWYTMFGDWFSGYDEGYENWLDDIYDDFINTLKTATFQNTRGEFFKGYYGRSFDV